MFINTVVRIQIMSKVRPKVTFLKFPSTADRVSIFCTVHYLESIELSEITAFRLHMNVQYSTSKLFLFILNIYLN